MSAGTMAANGPGPMPASSMTRNPCNGPAMSVLLGATAVGGDGGGDRRPRALGEIVAHALDHQQLGPRHGLGGGLPARWGDERVGPAVDHQRRDVDRAERL